MRASSRAAIRVHLIHFPVRYTIVVLDEGGFNLAWCSQCDMFVLWEALNGRHLDIAMGTKGAEQKFRRMVEEETRASTAADFQTYSWPLEAADSFKNLRRVLATSEGDFRWGSRNLVRSGGNGRGSTEVWFSRGGDAQTSGTFYKAAIQATILFRSYTWVMTPRIGRTLGGFHHRMAHYLAGMKPRPGTTE